MTIRERHRPTRPVPTIWPNGSAVLVQNSPSPRWGQRYEEIKGFLGRMVYDAPTRTYHVWQFKGGFYRYAGSTTDGVEARARLRD
jgi:hypothetical protein